MSMADGVENALLKLIFQAVAWADYADNDATSPLTSLVVSLHTADPGEAGTQSTSETTYSGYARVSVARTTGGWTVTANSVSPAASIPFPQCTSDPATITHFGVGSAASGAGFLAFSGAVTPSIAIVAGVVPALTTTSAITLD